MKTILILRHGKSSWGHNQLADHDRPLKKRGKHDAPRMGQLIYAEGVVPDAILSSTAFRARDTAELAAEACGFAGEIQFRRDLYHSWPEDIFDILRSLNADIEIAMVVSHNPGLEALLYSLTDVDEWLPTAALAQVRVDIATWNDLTDETEGELVNLWRPQMLK
jgi:phosphohistidine phosphatase